MSDQSQKELLDLIDAVCDEQITDDQLRVLAEMLRTDPQARATYVNYVDLRLNLADLDLVMPIEERSPDDQLLMVRLMAEHDLPATTPLPGIRPQASGESSPPAGSVLRGFFGGGFPVSLPLAGLGGLLAASVLIASFTGIIVGRRLAAHDDGGSLASVAPGAHAVAKITGTRDCLWVDPDERLGFTSPLYPGQRLDLRKGLVEITFRDGAKVILQGPASLVVASADNSQLRSGRLTATVPEQAEGFTIVAPGMKVTQHGSVFGMYSDESGSTEVHALDGRVDADLIGAEGGTLRTLHLAANQGARLNNAHRMLTQLVADSEGFVRSLAPPSGPHSGMLAFDGFQYASGPLAGQNGGFGWGGAWSDISLTDRDDTNQVASGSLLFGDLEPTGSHAEQTGQRNRVRRTLATSLRGIFDVAGLVEDQDGVRLVGQDGTTIYLSFLQRVSAVDDGFYGLEVHRGDGNPNRVLNIGNGADGTGYGASSRYNGSAFAPLGAENAETNFFVVKFMFGINNSDRVTIYRNPTSLVREDLCTVEAELEGNFAFDRIGLGNFDGGKTLEVDRICLGVSFDAVTGHWREDQPGLARRDRAAAPQLLASLNLPIDWSRGLPDRRSVAGRP